MNTRYMRTIEQRNLLNPAFCAVVVWHIARGYCTESKTTNDPQALPLELVFVGASFVLRGQTRSQLPLTTRTSLATWIADHPMDRSAIAKGVLILRQYIREAILLGAQYGLISFTGSGVVAANASKKAISNYLRTTSSDEVRECARRAEFVGRWLYKGGAPSTVLAMLGVKA
ncbi:three component ABC system middle component [Marinobacter bryozoorum]|uniref:three component ABC system middle component n=1 Tax=Marinobacter bryozoorum TaxID=256324 RepID=UPI003CFBDEA0